MRFFRTPGLLRMLLPGFTWRVPTPHPILYLTFDDGPVPDVTDFVLGQLAQYEAKATFFCVGDNLRKYPDIAQRAEAAGHRLANHTCHHLPGWRTPTSVYIADIQACAAALEGVTNQKKNKLFRPPYGRINLAQYRLIKADYQIIMWEVLTYDFDNSLSETTCLHQAIKNTRAGSIVVFHDSLKARRNLQFVLPRYLAHFSALGYRFEAL